MFALNHRNFQIVFLADKQLKTTKTVIIKYTEAKSADIKNREGANISLFYEKFTFTKNVSNKLLSHLVHVWWNNSDQ